MSVSEFQRRSYRHAWRRLAGECLAAAEACKPTEARFATYALDSGKWVSPCEGRASTAMFGALGPMAYAYAKAETVAARRALAEPLSAWARLVIGALDALEPSPAAPALRPRADIDG